MRVMVIVKATKDSEAGKLPSEKLLTAMTKYNEELIKAGIMLAGEGLKPSSEAKRVVFQGSKRMVVDGPFSETKELVSGFWLWQVRNMDEAVEWLKRMPQDDCTEDGHDVEIRPVFEFEDFGEILTPETRAKNEELRRLATQSA